MKDRGIRISPKHGLNPAVPVCFFCGQHKNELVIPGYISAGDPEAPRNAVWDMEPCADCAEKMKLGILLISVDPKRTTDKRNPYRSGGWVIIKEEAFKRAFSGPIVETVLKYRWTFVEDEVWDKVGLPRESLGIAPAAGGDL